jgi:hypothetical protein
MMKDILESEQQKAEGPLARLPRFRKSGRILN